MIGIDLIDDTGYFNQRSAFLRHYAAIRSVILDCHVFLSVEANIGGHGPVLHMQWIKEQGLDANITMLREVTSAGRPGVWTSAELKSSMTDDLQVELHEHRILVYAGCIGRNPKGDIKELRTQLESFARYPSPTGKDGKCRLTGKGPANNQNDDGAMAFLLAHAMYKLLTSAPGCAKYNTSYMVCRPVLPSCKNIE